MFALFIFVRKRLGPTIAVLSVVLLITYPRFFGETFNNSKDVPSLIFFSLSVLAFSEWVFARKARYLYLGFLLWAFTLATKMDGVIVPIILLIWQLPHIIDLILRNSFVMFRTVLHLTLGVMLSFGTLLFLYPPFWPTCYSGKAEYLLSVYYFCGGLLQHVFQSGLNKDIGWNIYAPLQIFYTTPVLVLFLLIFGLASCFMKMRRNRIYALLLVWLFVPVLRQCLPRVNHYDGLRHFLHFVVPFSIIAAIGSVDLAGQCAKFLKIRRRTCIIMLTLCLLISNLYPLIITHPYQTTYFNSLIGGLNGAQEAGFPYSCDYWYNSYREAGAWLDNNAFHGAHCYSFIASHILKYNLSRADLELVDLSPQDISKIMPNSYIVVVAKKSKNKPFAPSRAKFLFDIRNLKAVYSIKRQGGEIATIYYKP